MPYVPKGITGYDDDDTIPQEAGMFYSISVP
jgi:hypothetical protein